MFLLSRPEWVRASDLGGATFQQHQPVDGERDNFGVHPGEPEHSLCGAPSSTTSLSCYPAHAANSDCSGEMN